jgi:hypothetical protein
VDQHTAGPNGGCGPSGRRRDGPISNRRQHVSAITTIDLLRQVHEDVLEAFEEKQLARA